MISRVRSLKLAESPNAIPTIKAPRIEWIPIDSVKAAPKKQSPNESAKTPIPKKVQPIKASINNKKPDTDKTDAPNGEKNTDNSSNENHLSSDKWNELLLNMNLTPFLKNYYLKHKNNK